MARFLCRDIHWDTDGKRVGGLPMEMYVEIDDERAADKDERDEALADALSDENCWCVAGFDWEPV